MKICPKAGLNAFLIALLAATSLSAAIEAKASADIEPESAAEFEDVFGGKPGLPPLNVRVNPFMTVYGSWNLDLDFALSRGFTLGPTVTYYHGSSLDPNRTAASPGKDGASLEAFAAGLRANIFLSGERFADGWMLSPYFKMAPSKITFVRDGLERERNYAGFTTGALMTYQWIWYSGFNLGAGAGLAYFGLPGSIDGIRIPGSAGLLPTFDLSVGYAL